MFTLKDTGANANDVCGLVVDGGFVGGGTSAIGQWHIIEYLATAPETTIGPPYILAGLGAGAHSFCMTCSTDLGGTLTFATIYGKNYFNVWGIK